MSVDYGQLLRILKGVLAEAQGVEDTAEHPDICLGRYVEASVPVDHFWRPIHQGGVLLKLFKHGFDLVLASGLVIEHFC